MTHLLLLFQTGSGISASISNKLIIDSCNYLCVYAETLIFSNPLWVILIAQSLGWILFVKFSWFLLSLESTTPEWLILSWLNVCSPKSFEFVSSRRNNATVPSWHNNMWRKRVAFSYMQAEENSFPEDKTYCRSRVMKNMTLCLKTVQSKKVSEKSILWRLLLSICYCVFVSI